MLFLAPGAAPPTAKPAAPQPPPSTQPIPAAQPSTLGPSFQFAGLGSKSSPMFGATNTATTTAPGSSTSFSLTPTSGQSASPFGQSKAAIPSFAFGTAAPSAG